MAFDHADAGDQYRDWELPEFAYHAVTASLSLDERAVERITRGYSKKALGFLISWHSLRATYVSRSLEQSPAVVMANAGDGPATILKYYFKLPGVVVGRFVEGKRVIPNGGI